MQKEKLQTKARNAMDESFCSSLQQGNNVLTLQSPLLQISLENKNTLKN
jgi:hypothetical protein